MFFNTAKILYTLVFISKVFVCTMGVCVWDDVIERSSEEWEIEDDYTDRDFVPDRIWFVLDVEQRMQMLELIAFIIERCPPVVFNDMLTLFNQEGREDEAVAMLESVAYESVIGN